MRDFTDKSRFTIRSVPEVFAGVSVSVANIKAKRGAVAPVRFSRELVLNSLFCYFNSLSADEQLRLYDEGLGLLVPVLQADDPSAGSPPASPEQVDVVVEDVSKPAGSKRKRGG